MNYKRIVVSFAFLSQLASGAAYAGPCPAALDWDSAKDIGHGMKYLRLDVTKPRRMANHIVRVDLHEPGLRVTGTGRAPEWGRPMPDYTNAVMAVDTRRQKVRDFLEEHRKGGTNMVFALNTSAWKPWVEPYTNSFGSCASFLVSDGKVVSHSKSRVPMMVVYTNNVAKITDVLEDADVPSVSVAHPSYDTCQIMKDGMPVKPKKKQHTPRLAPRTAMGLSKDGRWLYALVVDGRQKKYSEGADMSDLVRVLRAAGASDAINMDGGGSSTLVYWDEKKGESVIPNRHTAKRRKYRAVATSMGFYFEDAAPRAGKSAISTGKGE